MNTRWACLAICLMGYACASAQLDDAVSWQAERIRYAFPGKPPYDAWVMKPAEEGAINAGTFEAIIDRIYRTERNPTIRHVYLGATHRKGPLQDEVIRQLADTIVTKRYPTRHDSDGRMYLDGTTNALSQTMRQHVYSAILNTSVVKDMNRVLNKRGLRIERVSTEKLFIAAENESFRWDAIGWLIIGKAEQSAEPPPRTPPTGHSEGSH